MPDTREKAAEWFAERVKNTPMPGAREMFKIAADALREKAVHGRWIKKIDMVASYLEDCTEVFYECSVCEAPNIGESPYCPNCGAKMDGGNEDDKLQ